MFSYLPHAYAHLRTLLAFSRRFYWNNATRSMWKWRALFTIYYSTPRQFLLSSASSRSRRFNFWYRFANNFQDGTLLYLKFSGLLSKLWMHVLLVCVAVSAVKLSVRKVCPHYESGCFLLQDALKKVRKSYKNTAIFGNCTVLVFYCAYKSKRKSRIKLKGIAFPPYSRLNSVSCKKGY